MKCSFGFDSSSWNTCQEQWSQSLNLWIGHHSNWKFHNSIEFPGSCEHSSFVIWEIISQMSPQLWVPSKGQLDRMVFKSDMSKSRRFYSTFGFYSDGSIGRLPKLWDIWAHRGLSRQTKGPRGQSLCLYWQTRGGFGNGCSELSGDWLAVPITLPWDIRPCDCLLVKVGSRQSNAISMEWLCVWRERELFKLCSRVLKW